MHKVIGLTGGIGSGKSSFSDYLKTRNIPVVDTDVIARDVVKPGTEGIRRIVDVFGEMVLNPDGTLNRTYLRALIFKFPEYKKQLESILHPMIQYEASVQVDMLKQSKNKLIIVEIPLLIEAIQKGKDISFIDQIWVIDCPEELQLQRASKRDNVNLEQIKQIMDSQATRKQRLAFADAVITNSGSFSELRKQANDLIKQYLGE